MKITAIAVVSINGKLTRGNEPNIHAWTSKEDAQFFSKMRSKSRLIVMGSGTFDVENIKQDKARLRVVLTKNPKKYSKLTLGNSLEFSNQEPKVLVQDLEKRGYKEMLLVGGSKVFASFLKEKLISEIYLTIEPFIFGSGKPLFQEGEFSTRFRLASSKKLNSRGTLLLKYSVSK